MPDYSAMEEALEFLAPFGPDLNNGLTNHAPMATEALCTLGRGDAVIPWLEAYRKFLLPRPPAHSRIARGAWREALGQTDRTTDWTTFFEAELQEGAWREVAARWTTALAPAVCASATHGVIRVGHALRSLSVAESPARLRELAEGLGYWAACYQTLPTATSSTGQPRRARAAIGHVPVVPDAQRRFTGTIVSSLEALSEFPPFAPVIGMLDTTETPSALISDLTETFARVYLANARDTLGTIVFVHSVTSVTTLRSVLPLLGATAARAMIRYAWQASCGLYAAFGRHPEPDEPIAAPGESAAELVELAIAAGDEHAIKFTEACLREYALNASPAYLAAARHASGILGAS